MKIEGKPEEIIEFIKKAASAGTETTYEISGIDVKNAIEYPKRKEYGAIDQD